jgi:hypothetical protein
MVWHWHERESKDMAGCQEALDDCNGGKGDTRGRPRASPAEPVDCREIAVKGKR